MATLSFYKALELNDYPTFLLWLTDQDPVLASMVATRQEEFEAVLEKVSEKKNKESAVGRIRARSCVIFTRLSDLRLTGAMHTHKPTDQRRDEMRKT